MEDGVGPHRLRGLPRRAHEVAVHVGGLRQRAGRAAAARPRSADGAGARAPRARRAARARLLLQGPSGDARARSAPSVRDARALGGPEGRGVIMPAAADLAELVRLPAVLSVPGDVLVGAAASGQVGRVGRTAGLVASSSCLYLAGMALNDYADREVDALERPGRPIPSGRVTPAFALGLAAALTAGGAAFAIAADGPRALKVVAPLAVAVWGYDLALKPTFAATPSMSACRGLDVVMGAGAHGAAQALPAAAVVAAHTAVVTEVSRR